MNHQEFFARYKLDTKNDRLGSGAFGTVYKTYDRESNLWKAVKISEVRYIDNRMYSLISEFDTIKRISHHKNIANYEAAYQIEAPNGLFDYVIMQYYELGNLKQLLENAALDLEQRKDIVHGLLEGIKFLHQNAIIHRDLKPSNILIARDIDGQYVPKITDFGLSKVVASDASQLTSSFGGGTLEYSSPEQLYGHPIKANTDLWAFGVIAYEVLSGLKMFSSENTHISPEAKRGIIFQKIINGELPDISVAVPSPYDKIIQSCLVINNEERVQNASTLSSQLYLNLPPPLLDEETVIVAPEEKAAYDQAIKFNDVTSLQQFIERFPKSIFVVIVSEKLVILKKELDQIKILEQEKENKRLEEEAEFNLILQKNKEAADRLEKEAEEKSRQQDLIQQKELKRQEELNKADVDKRLADQREDDRKQALTKEAEIASAARLVEERARAAELARQNQIKELNLKDDRAFQKAIAENTIKTLAKYLKSFPQGKHIEKARIRIEELKKDKKPFPLWWIWGSAALVALLFISWVGIKKIIESRTEIFTYEQDGLYGYYIEGGDTITKAVFTKADPFIDGKSVAYINDSAYTVENDGSYLFTPRKVELNEKTLNLKLINEANLDMLYSLNNTYPNDPLHPEIIKRISELEKLRESEEYKKIKGSNNIKELEAFLIKYPTSKYANEIKSLISNLSKDLSSKSEMEFFDIVRSSNSKTLTQDYLRKYPKGKYTKEAQEILDKILSQEARQIWDQARMNNSTEKITAFINENPTSPYIIDAQKLLQQLNQDKQKQIEKTAWENAKSSNSVEILNNYILKYPASPNIKEAKNLIKNLEARSAELAKKESISEEPKEDNCAPIIATISQSFKNIPGGSYSLSGNEKSVSGFSISKFEITQEQYKAVMGDKNPSFFKDGSDLPIESISYNQIREFINKLNALSCNDYKYRLPTVAEWEYAALGGKNDLVYAGSDDANEVAVYGKKKIGSQRIGSKKANGFGLYDMSGNVAELCSDKNGITRKGGSWSDSKAKIEIKAGLLMPPQSNDNQTGFRLVREKK